MGKIVIARTNIEMPGESALDGVRKFLFGCVDGFGIDDKAEQHRS